MWFKMVQRFRAQPSHSKSGQLSEAEFIKVIEEFGVRLSAEDKKVLFQKFDKNCDGRISYKEFLHVYTGGGHGVSPPRVSKRAAAIPRLDLRRIASTPQFSSISNDSDILALMRDSNDPL